MTDEATGSTDLHKQGLRELPLLFYFFFFFFLGSIFFSFQSFSGLKRDLSGEERGGKPYF